LFREICGRGALRIIRTIKGENAIGHAACWLSGLLTLFLLLFIVIFLVLKGIHAINWDFITSDPRPSLNQNLTGGILTPIIGTFLLVVLGTLFALPWALATAIYLAEYTEGNLWVGPIRMGIDILSGVPTIVFAIFGLAIFTNPHLSFFSTMVEEVTNAKAFGRSFMVSSITMSMMVLPFIIKSIEEAIRAVPSAYKEAAYGLGISKWRTIRKIVLPSAISGIITGVVLGIGRIAGDTAIVWLCLGGSMTLTGTQPWWHPQNWLATLQNTGSTLTTYIFYSSPAGEGNSPDKAFGAGLILIVIILALNSLVDHWGRYRTLREE